MPVLSDLKLEELEAALAQGQCRPIHARRLLRTPSMTIVAISAGRSWRGRAAVEKIFDGPLKPRQSRIIVRTTASDGTVKLLIGFDDGGAVESVLMPSYRPERRMLRLIADRLRDGAAISAPARAADWSEASRPGDVEQFLHLKSEARQLAGGCRPGVHGHGRSDA